MQPKKFLDCCLVTWVCYLGLCTRHLVETEQWQLKPKPSRSCFCFLLLLWTAGGPERIAERQVFQPSASQAVNKGAQIRAGLVVEIAPTAAWLLTFILQGFRLPGDEPSWWLTTKKQVRDEANSTKCRLRCYYRLNNWVFLVILRETWYYCPMLALKCTISNYSHLFYFHAHAEHQTLRLLLLSSEV